MARGGLARSGRGRSEASGYEDTAIAGESGSKRLRPRPAEAFAHRDEMLGRDGLGKSDLVQCGLAAGMLAEGLAERGIAVTREVAIGGHHRTRDIGGDLMGCAEGEALRTDQRVGKLRDGDAGAADVLGDAPPVVKTGPSMT
mgnify:CR=1 FL=1